MVKGERERRGDMRERKRCERIGGRKEGEGNE